MWSALQAVTVVKFGGAVIDPTITVGNILTIVALIGGAIAFIITARTRIEIVKTDLNEQILTVDKKTSDRLSKIEAKIEIMWAAFKRVFRLKENGDSQ